MITYTPEARDNLRDYLANRWVPSGLEGRERSCSLVAINLALAGELTDDIPECMSKILGQTTIALQDTIPHDMLNSDRYRAWLITAPGTGREREQERLEILFDWMWETVLPKLQDLADKHGFGDKWQTMCVKRTFNPTRSAARAADRAADATRVAANAATRAADRAGGDATNNVARAAADAADAANDVARAAARVGNATNNVTRAAQAAVNAATPAYVGSVAVNISDIIHFAARAVDTADFWQSIDPIGVLERMTNLTETTQ